jgi:hypothetical protein
MKQLFVCVAVILFSACNNTPKDEAGKTNDTLTTQSIDTSTTLLASANPDTTVWAGSFAKMTTADGDKIPGEYDITNHVFVVCTSHVTVKVNPDSVRFENGHCDNGAPTTLSLMIINKDSAQLLPGELVRVDSTQGKVPTAVFRINNQERKVILNEKQYSNFNRIKATRKVNTHLQQPK